MDNTTLNASLPFLATILAAIITGAFQILVAYINPTPPKPPIRDILRQVKWRGTIIITTVVAIVVTALVFVTVSDSTHCAITTLNWSPYNNDGLGSTITVKPVMDSNCAIEISFDLQKGGWVAIYKKLDPKLLVWWIDGIEFSFSGMGKPNTIEIKLLDTHDTPYKAVWQNSTDTGGKAFSLSIPYGELREPGDKVFKRGGFVLDRIDFSFSNGPDDMPGPGNVVINDIRVILSWRIWLLIFSPILGIGIIVAYNFWQKRIKKHKKPPIVAYSLWQKYIKKHKKRLTPAPADPQRTGTGSNSAARAQARFARNGARIKKVSRKSRRCR